MGTEVSHDGGNLLPGAENLKVSIFSKFRNEKGSLRHKKEAAPAQVSELEDSQLPRGYNQLKNDSFQYAGLPRLVRILQRQVSERGGD